MSNKDLTTNDHSGHSDDESVSSAGAAENEVLARNETKAVTMLRATAILVLLGTAVAVCACAYVFTRNSERQNFENSYYDQAARVLDSFQVNAIKRVSAVENFALEVTSHARFTNSTWPYVTLPDFERRATAASKLAEVMSMIMVPLVTEETRLQWEAYSVENQGWFEDSLNTQEMMTTSNSGGRALQNQTSIAVDIPEKIYRVDGFGVASEQGPGPFLPQWQIAPVVPVSGLINFNLLSHTGYQESLNALLEVQVAILGQSIDFSDPNDEVTAGRRDVFNLFLENWVEDITFDEDPIADLHVPIYDDYAEDTRTLVGLLTCVVYWRTYFVDILPDNAQGVVVVLQNTCDQVYTYQINGPTVEYLGPGDLHDRTYSAFEVSTDKGAYLQVDNVARNVTGSCLYYIRVYPSERLESNFVTDQPMIYTIVLVLIFIFTSAVFITYDVLVERRQKLVMTTAVASTAIVSSLFPENVRGRLFETDTDQNGNPVKVMMDTDAFTDRKGKPIADLFTDCTIVFADIVGFTGWSSSREPTDVFLLLETLYGALDKIANRRRVFKVETIGDCYLAVTGLPEPQADHAIIMAQFANECLRRMRNLVTGELKKELGPETADLSMRFGLHSGPVTAGVLRGEKSRFQLFGDTVNTAARMESTGARGRIQISMETATLLIKAGKQHWLEERADVVLAKGKGELQTYWLQIDTNSSKLAGTLQQGSSDRSSSGDPSQEGARTACESSASSEFVSGNRDN